MSRMIVLCAATLFLPNIVLGQNIPDETCIRCFCHGRTGCFSLFNCARYSINQTYWVQGGKPTVLDDTGGDQEKYTRCMANEACIIQTLSNYAKDKAEDCNCDGVMDCKDFAAIHYGTCNSHTIPSVNLNRLDMCLLTRQMNAPRAGWTSRCSSFPDAQ